MGGSYKWPALDELIRYRNQVRDMVLDCIERFPFDLPVTQESPWVSHYACAWIHLTWFLYVVVVAQ